MPEETGANMADDLMKKIAEEQFARDKPKKPVRLNRTMKLNDELYRRLLAHTRETNTTVGDLMDRLMEAYLQTIDQVKGSKENDEKNKK